MRSRAFWTRGVVVLASLLACGEDDRRTDADPVPDLGSRPLSVYVVNYPLLYFAERIGGERVRAVLPAPPGVDPAHWSPEPETVAAYQRADLVLLNGLGYARWIERVSLRRSRLVDTSVAFADRSIPIEHSITHAHGPEGAHSHKGKAFAAWLDPELAREQAAAVREALSRVRPAWAEEFDARFERLEGDLRALERQLAAAAAGIGETPLVFSHPVYQYLERRYGLNGISLEWEPDEPPSERMWRALETLLDERPARWIVWEAEPLPETSKKLEVLGVRSVVYEPCAIVPQSGDFLTVMRKNAERLEAIGRTPADPL